MKTVNETLQDQIIHRSAVDLMKIESTQRTDVLKMLKALERDLVKELVLVDPTAPSKTILKTRRLQALLKQTRDTIHTHVNNYSKAHAKDLFDLAQAEHAFAEGAVNAALGVSVSSVAFSTSRLKELSKNTLVEGEYPAQWWGKQTQAIQDKYAREMRTGMLKGESIGELSRRIRNNVMPASRRNATAMVRTSSAAVVQKARLESYQQMSDLVKGYKYVATLDGNTTPYCKAADGTIFKKDMTVVKGPKWVSPPPNHWQCRSTISPITKSWAELEKQFKGTKTMDKLDPVSTKVRSAMDGKAPRDINYTDWLKGRSKDFQNEVLGVTRADLFRKGEITNMTQLLDQSGNPLTIVDLKKAIASGTLVDPITGTLYMNSLTKRAKEVADSIKYQNTLLAEIQDKDTTVTFFKETEVPSSEFKSISEPDMSQEPIWEPPEKVIKGKHTSTGAILYDEATDKVWIYEPKNHFGGYEHTFPKGTVEAGKGLQETAIREIWEETGLQVHLVDFLGDYEKTTSTSRYYIGFRKGGSPVDFGWEADNVKLVPRSKLKEYLNMKVDKDIADDFEKAFTKAINKGNGNATAGFKVMNVEAQQVEIKAQALALKKAEEKAAKLEAEKILQKKKVLKNKYKETSLKGGEVSPEEATAWGELATDSEKKSLKESIQEIKKAEKKKQGYIKDIQAIEDKYQAGKMNAAEKSAYKAWKDNIKNTKDFGVVLPPEETFIMFEKELVHIEDTFLVAKNKIAMINNKKGKPPFQEDILAYLKSKPELVDNPPELLKQYWNKVKTYEDNIELSLKEVSFDNPVYDEVIHLFNTDKGGNVWDDFPSWKKWEYYQANKVKASKYIQLVEDYITDHPTAQAIVSEWNGKNSHLSSKEFHKVLVEETLSKEKAIQAAIDNIINNDKQAKIYPKAIIDTEKMGKTMSELSSIQKLEALQKAELSIKEASSKVTEELTKIKASKDGKEALEYIHSQGYTKMYDNATEAKKLSLMEQMIENKIKESENFSNVIQGYFQGNKSPDITVEAWQDFWKVVEKKSGKAYTDMANWEKGVMYTKYNGETFMYKQIDHLTKKAAEVAKSTAQAISPSSAPPTTPTPAKPLKIKKTELYKDWENYQNIPDDDVMQLGNKLYDMLDSKDYKKYYENAGQHLLNYKKNTIAGKKITKLQLHAYNNLNDSGKSIFNKELEEAINQVLLAEGKAVTSTVSPIVQTKDLLESEFTQYASAKGSNSGGFFHRTTNPGEKWYFKFPDSEDIARNELLAGKLYEKAGVKVPELTLVEKNGQKGIASRIVDGVEKDGAKLTSGNFTADIEENFIVDAWLGDWDVVGTGYDNMLTTGNSAYRIDVGGSLKYRAQGSIKTKSQWSSLVNEIEDMRNPSLNSYASNVFKNVTEEQMEIGARKVLAISDDVIRDMVRTYGPVSKVDQDDMIKILIERKKSLAKRFPNAVPKNTAPVAMIEGESISASEITLIEDSRINGYSVRLDKDMIEDTDALFWTELDKHGGDLTVSQMTLRDQARDKFDKIVKTAAKQTDDRVLLMTESDNMYEAMRGISMQSREGSPLRSKDITRAKRAWAGYADKKQEIIQLMDSGQLPIDSLDKVEEAFKVWSGHIEKVSKMKEGQVYKFADDLYGSDALKARKPSITLTKKLKEITEPTLYWERKSVAGYQKTMKNSRAQRTGRDLDFYTEVWEAVDGDTTIRYWDSDSLLAVRGQLEITVKGKPVTGVEDIRRVMLELGIDSTRATPAYQEELYLIQNIYMRNKPAEMRVVMKKIKAYEGPDRISYLKKTLNQLSGKNVTDSSDYKPFGKRQAWGNGRVHLERPDLSLDPGWDTFEKDYIMWHDLNFGQNPQPTYDRLKAVLNGGGQMAPTTDKLRRGFSPQGGSPSSDMKSGGANYFFTRIIKVLHNSRLSKPGTITWKTKILKRVDSITYPSDFYGMVTPEVIANGKPGYTGRAHSLADIKKYADGSESNETIFKRSLSLFDNIEHISVEPSGYEKVMELFADVLGDDKFPDGRKISEVIIKARREF